MNKNLLAFALGVCVTAGCATAYIESVKTNFDTQIAAFINGYGTWHFRIQDRQPHFKFHYYDFNRPAKTNPRTNKSHDNGYVRI